jgi:DNA-binding IclR family transcriptional regulator
MTKLSPAVGRTVAVLNFFADHPGQAFTLTDLVKSLKLSRATCHALLAALVDAGYLYRTADKTYVLGAALARVGRVAQENASPIQAAMPELRRLADAFDAICSVVARDKDDAVVRERAASRSHLGWAISPGTRLPLRPPLGSIFLAWSSEAEVEAWIGKVSPPPGEAERAQMRAGLAFPREHGFSFGVRTVHIVDEKHAQSLVFATEQTDYLVADIAPDRVYELAFVAAPVFDARGRVAFVLALMGFTHAVTGAEVERIGAELKAAAQRVIRFIGGAAPS